MSRLLGVPRVLEVPSRQGCQGYQRCRICLACWGSQQSQGTEKGTGNGGNIESLDVLDAMGTRGRWVDTPAALSHQPLCLPGALLSGAVPTPARGHRL